MADLTPQEKRAFERVLAMGDGYVLNFSNRTFEEFVTDSTCPFYLTIAAPPGGRRVVGGRAHHSSLRRTLIPSRTLPRIVSPNTGSAGGKGRVGRGGPVPSI
jgi:hypothetical protein